jgi:hypothetical protein
METERARCRKCGIPVTVNQNVIFPKAGGVEHLVCEKMRKPLARISGDATGWLCLACDEPLLPTDQVVMSGHDQLHARCGDRLRAIGGGSGPSADHPGLARISDPFACPELLMQCEQVWLDAADLGEQSRHWRQAARTARKKCTDRDDAALSTGTARAELVAASAAIRLDVADVRAMSRYMQHQRSCGGPANHAES